MLIASNRQGDLACMHFSSETIINKNSEYQSDIKLMLIASF